MNRKAICIKDIDTSLSKEELKNLLLKVCPTGSGSICVPVDKNTGYTLGQAYCNFDDKKEGGCPSSVDLVPSLAMNISDIVPPRDTAKAALEKWRFTLKIRNKYVHMMYAVNMNMKNAKAKVFERPGCYKHFIVVKVTALNSHTMVFAACVCSLSTAASPARQWYCCMVEFHAGSSSVTPHVQVGTARLRTELYHS